MILILVLIMHFTIMQPDKPKTCEEKPAQEKCDTDGQRWFNALSTGEKMKYLNLHPKSAYRKGN